MPATALLAVLASGCTLESGPAAVSGTMRISLLPNVGAFAGFDQVADWRHLDRPTAKVRDYFDSNQATYRVIDADPHTAQLAVWQTGAPGAEPFNANEIATGTGCVALHRQSGSVASEVIDCPSPLAETQPDSMDASWGRDSEAMSNATGLIKGAIDEEVRWLMTKEPGGVARTTPRTLEQVVATVNQTVPPDGAGFVLSDVQQHHGTVTGLIEAYASGADPVDTRRTVQARACAKMTVVLGNVHPNFLFTDVACVDA